MYTGTHVKSLHAIRIAIFVSTLPSCSMSARGCFWDVLRVTGNVLWCVERLQSRIELMYMCCSKPFLRVHVIRDPSLLGAKIHEEEMLIASIDHQRTDQDPCIWRRVTARVSAQPCFSRASGAVGVVRWMRCRSATSTPGSRRLQLAYHGSTRGNPEGKASRLRLTVTVELGASDSERVLSPIRQPCLVHPSLSSHLSSPSSLPRNRRRAHRLKPHRTSYSADVTHHLAEPRCAPKFLMAVLVGQSRSCPHS
ncbi:hypothetical protein BC827DRAFT_511188 [Russula dissimulans]|nr:hypothetical protein BC827DRAFT_511188 [Russula dissimulans]